MGPSPISDKDSTPGEAQELGNAEPSREIDFSALVRADQALGWLAPILGGRTIAKAEIADLMRDGSIEVFARRAWDSKAINPVTAWVAEPDEDDEFTDLELDINVNASVWRRSRRWMLDQVDWRWPSGRFTVVHRLRPFRRILIEDVHFDPNDIKRVGELHAGKAGLALEQIPLASEGEISRPPEADDTIFEAKGKDTKKRGRRTRGRAWATVCNELWRLRESGELANGRFNGVQKLAYHCSGVSKQSGDEGLGQGTIEPLITALIGSGFIPKQGTK